MEIRNVQRTGKMHYVYLSTGWCKKNKITSDTKVRVIENNDGSLLISPDLREQEQKVIDLSVPADLKDVLVNIIMACYVNPTSSFRIRMEKKIDVASIFKQKTIISQLEFVELDGEHITYEESMDLKDPDSLLKTMLKKIKNLLLIMIQHHDAELINKYEEEIDRSKTLIQKSVISALVLNKSTTIKPIDMHYTLQIATELERVVDYIILVDPKEKKDLEKVLKLIEMLKENLEDTHNLDYLKAAQFTKQVHKLKDNKTDNLKNANEGRIKRILSNISEVLLDWSITRKIEN